MARILPLLALLALACRKEPGPDTSGPVDADGDGLSAEFDCDDNDPSAGAVSTWYQDADGDGYGNLDASEEACTPSDGAVDNADDCNDSDPAVHPGASEIDCADPTDYNCDGSVGYADADGDGYPACEDCDDGAAAVSPDAQEVCDDIDNDCSGVVDDEAADASTWYGDSDGDGYGGTRFVELSCEAPSGFVANADDCDDLDETSYPGGAEVCDEADNNCDGEVDEGAQITVYQDSDGDGYGDPDFPSLSCDTPEGYADNASDCDDGDAAIRPDATELCDSVDNDCDGDIDEAGAYGSSTFYADTDGDGYGDPSSSTQSCSATTGYVKDNDDCDDSDKLISPSGTELCDGVDNNCDGDTDEDSAADAGTWYRDGDADGYGDSSRTTVACDTPSGYLADDTDCDDGDKKINPSAKEVCDGDDNDCDGSIDDDDSTLDTSSASVWYQDADGDGYGGSSTTLACDLPSGYSTLSTDCDDSDSGANPGATEIVDGADNNCDGLGYHGTYAASSSTSLAGGAWEYTSFTVGSGVTITVTGSTELQIYVLGAADIKGTIAMYGAAGETISAFSYTPRAGGAGGGGGGGDGGYGSSYYVHGYPYGAAGSGYGDAPGLGGIGYSSGSGGGGGGQLAAGETGESSGGCYAVNAGGAGGASVNSSTSPKLIPGSGGGGGGYGTGYNSDGGGGGGGGGAMYLEASTLTISGTVSCYGGAGGGTPGTSYHAAAGGGGSGGTLWLVGDTIKVSGTINCKGGLGGVAYEGGHCGLAGDGGDGADGLIYIDGGSVSVTGTVSPTWYKP